MWRAVEVDRLVAHGLPRGRGLDLGCGDGLLTQIVLDEVGPRTLVGIDPDPAEAEQARRLGIYEKVHVAGGDAVPEPDSSFDFVLSNSVLEHIPEIEPVLGEVGRVLKPGGSFVFTVPSTGFHVSLRGPLLPWASRAGYLDRLDRRLAHRRYWGAEEWRAALARNGLRLVSADGYMDAAQVRRWESISRFTAGVLYTLAARRRLPIDIQRGLGLRKAGRRMPRAVSRRLGTVLGAGLNGSHAGAACLLVEALKD
ncbi:MAG TPA: class I SAM-dependent methyltransferase [Candidatus Dormibacteraeota bacterium]|nr:class I SAM-dependent methyltransferase [Candidatus Dormibacteraeota bacterium]